MRHEYKYLASMSDLDAIRRKIEPYVRLDKYAEKRQNKDYTVKSIYLDNAHFEHYHDKIEGYKIRKKLRIRGYNELEADSTVFLEIKRKFESYIDKDRTALRFSDLTSLFETRDFQRYLIVNNGNLEALEAAQKFFFHLYRKALKPVVLVIYDREAFHCHFNPSLRITFDKRLRCRLFPALDSLYDDGDLSYPLRDRFILEIKFTRGIPLWAKELIKELRLSRYALSKYTICMDANKRVSALDKKVSFLATGLPEPKDVYPPEEPQVQKGKRRIVDVARFQ